MKYHINQDFQMRVFNMKGGENKMSRYYSFYNSVSPDDLELVYSEITLKAILEECEKEKVDYLIYYYCHDFYKQFRFKEFLIFKELLEENR